jgi:hypothetical protein
MTSLRELGGVIDEGVTPIRIVVETTTLVFSGLALIEINSGNRTSNNNPKMPADNAGDFFDTLIIRVSNPMILFVFFTGEGTNGN